MSKTRVVIIFGKPSHDLGVLAGRVVNGPGGIDKGSMVSVVRALQAQASSEMDSSPPGIVLANTGQLYWWPEGKRALTVMSSIQIPLPSMVHLGRRHVHALNTIPQNEYPASHVDYVFRKVIGSLAKQDSMISLIAIGESCELVTKFLDDEANWATWGDRMSSMLLLGNVYPNEGLKNPALEEFLAKVCLERPNSPRTCSPASAYPSVCHLEPTPRYGTRPPRWQRAARYPKPRMPVLFLVGTFVRRGHPHSRARVGVAVRRRRCHRIRVPESAGRGRGGWRAAGARFHRRRLGKGARGPEAFRVFGYLMSRRRKEI